MAVGRSRSRRPPLVSTLTIAAVAASLLSARPAPAQYLNAYKAGLDAIEAKDWERADRSMSEALAQRGEEKAKLPVKLFLRPYLPHFYLGYARFERGDCAGALAAWAESERQGVATRLPDFELARRGRKTCEEYHRKQIVAQARQAAQQSLARSTAAGAALLSGRASLNRARCGAMAIPRRRRATARVSTSWSRHASSSAPPPTRWRSRAPKR